MEQRWIEEDAAAWNAIRQRSHSHYPLQADTSERRNGAVVKHSKIEAYQIQQSSLRKSVYQPIDGKEKDIQYKRSQIKQQQQLQIQHHQDKHMFDSSMNFDNHDCFQNQQQQMQQYELQQIGHQFYNHERVEQYQQIDPAGDNYSMCESDTNNHHCPQDYELNRHNSYTDSSSDCESGDSSYCEVICNDNMSIISNLSDDPIDKFFTSNCNDQFNFPNHNELQAHSVEHECLETGFKFSISDKAHTLKAISNGKSAQIQCPECSLNMIIIDTAKYILCERCNTIFQR